MADDQDKGVEAIALWKLPDNFFQLSIEGQFEALKEATFKPQKLTGPRTPCKLSLLDEALVAGYLFVVLGGIWVVGVAAAVLLVIRSPYFKWSMALLAVMALHPIPRYSVACRSTRLSLALARYFTFELLVDRQDPIMAKICTIQVCDEAFLKSFLPVITLACPHGVFNWGAFTWCCLSRWILGWYQYTGATTALRYVPAMRYMDPIGWCVEADRKTIKKCLQPGGPTDAARCVGGMIGMVPDGILGAFRQKPGIDELFIGKKRGLMRIALEEGATIVGGWFYGTNDLLTVVQDPFGLLEALSRKIKAGLLGYYGRWFLPVPYRIAVSVAVIVVQTEKTAAPTEEQVEELHEKVYGRVTAQYRSMRAYAGYPNRDLVIR